MKKDSLEALNAAICNPFNKESTRLKAVAVYRKPLTALVENSADVAEVVGAFKKHVSGSLIMVAEDPSEKPMLRRAILDLAISFPLRELARLDEAARNASKISVPGVRIEWPDIADAVCRDFDFLGLLDRIMTIAEDRTEEKNVRRSAVSAFNNICRTATEFRIKIDREPFNSRLLSIGETTTDPILRKYALSMGY